MAFDRHTRRRVSRMACVAAAIIASVLLSGQTPCDAPLTVAEGELAALIGQLRAAHGLPAVPATRSLTKVARLHVNDLNLWHPDTGTDSRGQSCNLHSWSAHGSWTAVCYTDDHFYKSRMWSKPREITGVFTDHGFEIAHVNSVGATPASVVAGWKGSGSHLDVILQRDIWASSAWKSMGVGIEGKYAVIWFAASADPAGPIRETLR